MAKSDSTKRYLRSRIAHAKRNRPQIIYLIAICLSISFSPIVFPIAACAIITQLYIDYKSNQQKNKLNFAYALFDKLRLPRIPYKKTNRGGLALCFAERGRDLCDRFPHLFFHQEARIPFEDIADLPSHEIAIAICEIEINDPRIMITKHPNLTKRTIIATIEEPFPSSSLAERQTLGANYIITFEELAKLIQHTHL